MSLIGLLTATEKQLSLGRLHMRPIQLQEILTPMLVQSVTHCSKGQAHPRSSECDCGQAVLTRPSHSDRMVSSSGGLQPPWSNLAPSPGQHVCDQVQLETDQVHVSSTRSQCLGSGCSNNLLGGPGHVCLSPSVVTWQSGQQTVRE